MLPATCCSTPHRGAILAGRGTRRPFPRPGGPDCSVGLVGESCGLAVLVGVKEPGSVGEGWPPRNKIEADAAETEGGRGMSRLPMVRGESMGKLDGTVVLISGSDAPAPVIASQRSGSCTTSDVTPTLYDPCTLEMDDWRRTVVCFRPCASKQACISGASTTTTCLEDCHFLLRKR